MLRFFALLLLSGTVLFAADESHLVAATAAANSATLGGFDKSWHSGVPGYYNPEVLPSFAQIRTLPREKFAQNGSVGMIFDGHGQEGILHLVCNSATGFVEQQVFTGQEIAVTDTPFSFSAADGLATLSGVYTNDAPVNAPIRFANDMLSFDGQLGFEFKNFAINASQVVAAVFYTKDKRESLTFASLSGVIVLNGTFMSNGITIEVVCESAALALKAPAATALSTAVEVARA